jgi:hypothetical protein
VLSRLEEPARRYSMIIVLDIKGNLLRIESG